MRILPAKPVDPSEKPKLVVQGAAPLITGTHPYDGDYGFSCPGCGTILVETVDPQYYMRYVLECPECGQRCRVFVP
jgi:hypothetical protein